MYIAQLLKCYRFHKNKITGQQIRYDLKSNHFQEINATTKKGRIGLRGALIERSSSELSHDMFRSNINRRIKICIFRIYLRKLNTNYIEYQVHVILTNVHSHMSVVTSGKVSLMFSSNSVDQQVG